MKKGHGTMISLHAVVETETIGSGVEIGEFSIVRSGVLVGDNVIIHPHVVIESGVTLGEGSEIFPGSYIGKIPKGAGATSRPIVYQARVRIGRCCAIGPNAVIYYSTQINDNTLIGDGASIREQCRIGSRCIISRYVTINYNSVIGDRTKVMDLTHITGNCEIGADVFIGTHVATTNDNDLPARRYVPENIIGPTIRDHATIGSGATLLPGITIGEGAVVGAQALVSKNVAPYKVVVGVPARVVQDLRSAGGGGNLIHDLALVETEHIGAGTRVWAHAHILPGARIGCDCNICDHTFIENDVLIGDRVTIKSGVFLWDGLRIGNGVFIGPGATFTNDRFPRSKRYPSRFLETRIEDNASIGANATVLPGLTIGRRAMVGAGAVVIEDVPADTVVVGNPARCVKIMMEENRPV